MRKLLVIVSPLVLALAAFIGVLLYLSRNEGKGALQVTATPKSNVYLNGKLIGTTPLCKCEAPDFLPAGQYTLRLTPLEGSFSPFEERIAITKSVLTVVDRTFGPPGSAEGSIISLDPLSTDKTQQMFLLSFPDNATVFVDNNPVGTTPLLLKSLTESDHEVKLVREGYKDKKIRIRTVRGYKLTLEVFLGVRENLLAPPASPTPVPSQVPMRVVILTTPTGFLRVRDTDSLAGAEVGRVFPGETYDLVSESSGWYQIKLPGDVVGWISSQYATKQ